MTDTTQTAHTGTRRYAVAFNALSRALSMFDRFVALSEREHITAAVLNAVDAEAMAVPTPATTTQWSVRHPGGTVDSRQFTGEAAARLWADVVDGEVVHRAVGEWTRAEVQP